jgi:phospholipase C
MFPINHVVIITKENHTFDNYFGTFPGATGADIPSYWAFAQQYTLCDNYFTDVAGQSEPNHLFLIAADSPLIDNSSSSRRYQPQPPFDIPSLPQTLAAAGHTWRNYADLNSSYFEHITALKGNREGRPSIRAPNGRLSACSRLPRARFGPAPPSSLRGMIGAAGTIT